MSTRPHVLFFIALLGLCGTGCSHESSAGTQQDRGRGAVLFAKNCSMCHEAAPGSRIGPPLEHAGRRLPLDRIKAIIEEPDPPMPKLYPSVLSRQDVDDIAAYVKTL